ncbi:MAG: molybdopterin/thiamine biosynthesis adenylyltransferase [Verrucomicrobiales bacterium]|jgi:molybdopterin/thiamine biosynthesis adenylyltransferase
MPDNPSLTDQDRAFYEWQFDVPGFGEAGQLTLRNTTALVTRLGGLGGPIAFALAAAGIGKLILAHGGNLEPSDLNRQILMRHDDLGKLRVESAAATLRAFNPHIKVEAIASHVTEDNAADLVNKADIVFDAAPRFTERFWLNRECVAQGKPMIDAAMYNMEGQITVIVPGVTPCLACLYPEEPVNWKRRFPVIGAVSAMIGNMAVLEGIKLLTGLGKPALNEIIYVDTLTMNLRKIAVTRRSNCPICQS